MARAVARTALVCASLLYAVAVTMAWAPTPEDSFHGSLEIAGQYHRALANLPAKYADQPETAAYTFALLTTKTLDAQLTIDVQPCFVRWWAHEYMGLELTALSHELRSSHQGYEETADTLERLGTRMWAIAQALLPDAASDCGCGSHLRRS